MKVFIIIEKDDKVFHAHHNGVHLTRCCDNSIPKVKKRCSEALKNLSDEFEPVFVMPV